MITIRTNPSKGEANPDGNKRSEANQTKRRNKT
jgi:hypothetical protein